MSILVMAACAEQPWQGPEHPGTPAGEQLRLAVQCTADVVAREVRCVPPAPGAGAMASGRLIMGGQGSYVLLASANTTYDNGTQVLQTDVTLQNRSAQPLGTYEGDDSDGTRAEGGGIRVFFPTGPVTTGGTGVVTVANPDSVMNITGPGQPAFIYEEMLEGENVSAPKAWQFNVPTTVTSFSFQVQVSARVPQVGGVLRYRQDGAALNGITCASASFCFAVGNAGTIRAWTGSTWVWTGTGTTRDLFGIATVSTTFAMAVGMEGTALRWNGVYWKATGATGVTGSLRGVWCASATDCFAVGDGAAVIRWNAVTDTWSAADDGVTETEDLYGIWGTAANNLYLAGNAGLFMRWNGTTWTDVGIGASADLRGIWGTGAANIYLVGAGGGIWRGTGPTSGDWSPQTSPTSADLRAVGGLGVGNIFAVGSGGTVLQTLNSGTTWTDLTPGAGAGESLFGVSGGGTNLFLVGAGGTMVASTNSGSNWAVTSRGTAYNLNAVWGTSSTNVYAVGDGGTIMRWDGSKLTPLVSGTNENLNAIWGVSAGDIYAVGNNGTVLRSTNGTTWALTDLGTFGLRAVWGSAANNIYVVGDTGAVRHWNGITWTPVVVPAVMGPGPRNLNTIWGSSATDIHIGGDTGVIIHFNGATWNQVPYETGYPQNRDIHGIWGTSPADIWAVAKHTVLLHNNGVVDTAVIDGDSVKYNGPWDHINVDRHADVLAVHGTGVADVYAVSDSGEVFHQNRPLTGHGGGSSGYWSRMTVASQPHLALRGVWAASPTLVFIVGDAGLFIRGVR
jgi:hypothetical protein